MESIGAILRRFLAGHRAIGVCQSCWVRQPLAEGARCLSCRGYVARVRLN